jgi:putative transposase
MVTPAVKKQAVQQMQEQHGLSQRRACALAALSTCSWRYQSRRQDDALVRGRLKELTQERPRFGYRRLGVLLRREGHEVNLKRVLRLYREEGLKLRAKKRKRIASSQRVRPEATTAINQVWSMDFVSDTLSCGRRFRGLNIVDCHSREALCIEVDTSLTGQRVVRVLQRLGETRGLPQTIQVDNGPEFTGRVLDEWAFRNRVKLHFIEPSKPVQNAVIESFNGKMRDECLNQEWFTDLDEARTRIEKWREDYNEFRPHSSLDNLAPAVWAQQQDIAENLYAPVR